jgi:hypothetical protein
MDRITMRQREDLGFFASNDSILLGSFRKLQVWYSIEEEDLISIEVIDSSISHKRIPSRKKRVLEIQLSKSEDFTNSWHINMARLDYRYAGQGIAARAYSYIIKKLDIMLQAGDSQSKGGRKIWFDLARDKRLTVSGQTKHGKPAIVSVDKEAREVRLQGKTLYDGARRMYVFAYNA